MPEGVMVAGSSQVAAAVHDDPENAPPPSRDAPRGWTWGRKQRAWQPRQRGPVLWSGDDEGGAPAGPVAAAASEPPGGQQRDPDPGWMTGGDERGDRKLDPADVPQAVKDDIAGLAGLVATPLLAMIQSVDPYCGGALANAFGGVLDVTLPLICRSEKIVRYFTEDKSDWLMWGKLAMALAPVGRAIVEHHITRTVYLVRDEKTGRLEVVRGRRGESEHGDHLTPQVQPEPQYQYAA